MTDTNPNYMKTTGFFNPSQHGFASVTQVGVGGIGSFAGLALAKMGVPRLRLIDPDHVEAHNLPSQMYTVNDLNAPKVEALAYHVNLHAPECDVTTEQVRLEDTDKPFVGVVCSGLDSMEARAALWEKVKLSPNVDLLIDGRLDGEMVVIYTCHPNRPEDAEQYALTLHSDEEGDEPGLCTHRNIIDVGFTVGAQIARLTRLHLNDQEVPPITVINQHTNVISQGGWVIV